MKYQYLSFNVKHKTCFTIFLLLTLFTVNSFAVNIIVDIQGLHYTKGNAIVSLYNSAKSFAKEKEFFKQKVLNIRKETKEDLLVVTFKDIPAGTYAIQIIHDKNKNGH